MADRSDGLDRAVAPAPSTEEFDARPDPAVFASEREMQADEMQRRLVRFLTAVDDL